MFDQILDLVGQPPGSLIYHFIILFAIEASLAISFGQWMRERTQGTARLTIAILTLFLARTLVLIASLLIWLGYLPSNVLLPPIERAVDTITILALIWAFVTMDDPELLQRNFVPDVVAAVLLGVMVAGFIGTYYYWFFDASSGQLFNGMWLDVLWNTAQIILAIVGLVWMLTRVRYIYDPFLKGFILVILGGASTVHLVKPVLGDVAAAVRVGQIIAVPMLASVAYRHVVEKLLHWDQFEPSQSVEAIPEDVAPEMAPPMVPPPGTLEPTRKVRPIEPQPKTPSQPALLDVVESLGGLLSTLDQEQIVQEASRVAATALRADICVLAVIDEEGQQAGVLGGYDNIAQNYLPQTVLDLGAHPTIVNALGRLRQMRLTTQRNLRELRDLYIKLGITHQGPAYLQPLVDKQDRIGVLIVGSPYSERQLSNEERNLLDRLAPLVTSALLNAERHQRVQEEGEQIMVEEGARLASLADELTARTTELDGARQQMREMKAYIRDMHRQVEGMREQLEEAEALKAELEKLKGDQEESKQGSPAFHQAGEEIQRLREDNERLLQKVLQYKYEAEQLQQQSQGQGYESSPATPSSEHLALQRELEETRTALQNELVSLRAKLTQASIGQQEVSFLQEQLAAKAREAISLQARLTEAQAVAEALQEQVGSNLGGERGLGSLQARVAEQANEIVSLKERLIEAQANVALAPEALRAQQDMDRFDRETTAQLEAQLTERKALAEALETQLTEKTRAIAELRAHMADVEASLHNLERQLSHKTEEIDTLQKSLSEARAQAQGRIAALQAGVPSEEGDQAAEAQVAALEAELAEKSAAIEVLETQLKNATQAISAFEQQLSATHEAVDQAISGAGQGNGHNEVIASIAQELRTPMSSIMGYTELLLRESVGILGSLQRKFLQRVKANTERMGVLLDDLIRITSLDTGQMQLEPEKVDVIYTVEETVMNVASQYRGKGLTLRMALAEGLPPLTADRDALLQVLGHLLSNAALASPVEGEVQLLITMRQDTLLASDDTEVETQCLYIAVEDSGTGIDPEDFDRVFMRKYRADNPLIEGLGDTGVSLSLAKTLIDEHNGRIWLDSQQTTGTIFHVLLPFAPLQVGGQQ
ncbi:MAG: GAF domain-containing protein [Anaerolineae bacterium]|nr:GAF domain-containing protein [Anaerolineae bacterium]